MKRAFFQRNVHAVAPELIGAELYVDGVGGTIVEVEAYDHEDPAAHGYGGRRTERNASMNDSLLPASNRTSSQKSV